MPRQKTATSRPADWATLRAAERPVVALSPYARHRLALGYANTYHVGMSSLGFQRTFELAHRQADWAAERFFVDGGGMPVTLETGTPISDFAAVAFSVSFEEDYVGLVALLDRAGIPSRRARRGEADPLVVLGGSCAAINPLAMSEVVDIFALGASENVLAPLQAALAEEPGRDAVLERLAATPGFYVPAHHDAAALGDFDDKLKKLELSAEQMRLPGNLPTTVIVTPHTEFRDKFLIEMSRGCPEKCRYCWATFGMGKFRWHPTEHIEAAMERARAVTDQLGFVATAVGDHPEVEGILTRGLAMGFRCSVSSIRIPAVTEGVLAALHASGDRSITLAPETGSDSLRAAMGKPIPNSVLLDKVRLIFAAGLTQLKLYFIVGLPGESDEDVQAILDLAREVRGIMQAAATRSGVMGQLHLGVNVLVPKPFTPWQREPMAPEPVVKARLATLRKGVARLPNVSMGQASYRQALWQAYLSKGGPETADAVEAMARGEGLSAVLRRFAPAVEPAVYAPLSGDLAWHFMRTG